MKKRWKLIKARILERGKKDRFNPWAVRQRGIEKKIIFKFLVWMFWFLMIPLTQKVTQKMITGRSSWSQFRKRLLILDTICCNARGAWSTHFQYTKINMLEFREKVWIRDKDTWLISAGTVGDVTDEQLFFLKSTGLWGTPTFIEWIKSLPGD